jgi:hypothetical protein
MTDLDLVFARKISTHRKSSFGLVLEGIKIGRRLALLELRNKLDDQLGEGPKVKRHRRKPATATKPKAVAPTATEIPLPGRRLEGQKTG